ncbi:MAG TPA: FdtA/QdtA family cupin domain-containing protein [Methylomirabilota bacterium]|nr:FdtA/QdtA family cupin domain-containing protein [Methylomirabilota bacterium]
MGKSFQVYTLKKIETKNLVMSPVELNEYIDFEVKRVYFITKPTESTSQHCHFEEKEFFILIQGSCTAVVDQGNGKEEILMTGSTSGIYVPNFVWHGFKDFSNDAILLALSSTNYRADRSDYLEDYDEYLKIRDEKLKKEA